MTGQVRPAVALAQDLGAVPDSQVLSGLSIHFSLTAAQQADLAQLQTRLQDPNSPQFHKFLTPEQYGARFGLNKADLEKVTEWLEQSGFSDVRVSRSRNWVNFSGTAAQVQAAFRAPLHRYSYRGEEHFANAADPLLPRALQGVVSAVLGLHNFRLKPNLHLHPLLNLTSSSHALTPEDVATIYDLKPLYNEGLDGTGVKIAIIAQSNVNLSDVASFRTAAGLPANAPQVILASTDPGIHTGDESEADLDLEWAGGIGKNATVLLIVGNPVSGRGVGEALSYAIENNVAPIVSISYGSCEQDLTAAEFAANSAAFAQASAQGMTLLAASGDNGAAGCDSTSPATRGLSASFPPDSQYVTGVGGTMFAADSNNAAGYWNALDDANGGSALSYIGEAAWHDPVGSGGQIGASGGGVSVLEAKPSWQAGTNVPNDGARDVPDIAFSASVAHDPYVFCNGGSCVTGFANASNILKAAGGTSVGAPVMAGITALLVQKTGQPQGNLNPRLYAIAASAPDAFHDVTQGDNRISCQSNLAPCPVLVGYPAGPGYDLVTGWGSLDAANFVAAWPDFGISPAAATITVPRNTSATVNIAVSQVNGFNGNLTLGCSVAASLINVTCSLPANATGGTAALSITAGPAPAAQMFWRNLPLIGPSNPWWFATALLSFALFLVPPFRKAQNRSFLAAMTLILVTSFSTISCGDGSSSGAKAPAVKSIPETGLVTVTAVSGEATKSVNVTVTVP